MLSVLVISTITAILWPMPALELPVKHDPTLIESVNIIDVKKGNTLQNRNVLIKKTPLLRLTHYP